MTTVVQAQTDDAETEAIDLQKTLRLVADDVRKSNAMPNSMGMNYAQFEAQFLENREKFEKILLNFRKA